ncbi:hypothetical protein TNCV_904651 [Trichonephila clavipes]|nr:hypothetical protein TNCV_904651 [Trichonephila clavipes]
MSRMMIREHLSKPANSAVQCQRRSIISGSCAVDNDSKTALINVMKSERCTPGIGSGILEMHGPSMSMRRLALGNPAFILERSRKWLLIGSTPPREKQKVALDGL